MELDPHPDQGYMWGSEISMEKGIQRGGVGSCAGWKPGMSIPYAVRFTSTAVRQPCVMCLLPAALLFSGNSIMKNEGVSCCLIR